MEEYNIEETLKSIFDSNDVHWKPSDKIPLITKEIERLKSNVVEYINNSNYDIPAILAESQELCVESKSLGKKLKSCREEIENETMKEITHSIESHGKISRELESVEFALNIVNDVIQCGKFVKEFDEGREAQSFTRAVQAVNDLLEYIETPSEGLTSLELYANTKNTAQLILDSLLHDLFQEWDRMVNWIVKANTKRTVITMTLNVDESLAVIDVLCALDRCKKIDEKVKTLAQFILSDILTPIMNNDCIIHIETEELLTLTVNYKLNFKPTFETVLSQIKMFFNYLSNKFDVEFQKDKTIMKMIGREICDDFRDVLIRDCLVDTVPNNINDLQSYGKITSQIQEFQQFLTFKKFFPDEEYSILEYVKDIDVIFADRSSQYFLETARSIMMKDLSLTMSIGVEKIPEESIGEQLTNEDEEEALQIFDTTIPTSLFYFPRCMISKSAQELLDLVYVMMEQAVQCSDVVCKKLFNASRLVFELYDAVVPYHHENYLQTIPQYVALFHNNCMYLAHNLLTFGDKWLILMEGRDVDYPIGFLDLVQKLRDLGYKYLTIHMQQQRKQILDNIRSSDLNCIVVKDILGDNAEAAVRQCLRQLQLLKNVWIGVFPTNVFTSLMATLVNMFVEELIHRVCTVEDISMEMATQLTEMYTLVIQKAPLLFLTQTDVEENVKTWIKLQGLIFVLKGSLKDIENHWNEGNGPLAMHFKIPELRSLIKALFQNTQIRANLLSKIK